ncbi:MAG: hypothetical protein DMF68_06685 [Acidobacteria bacterium]|nr:MAG: hypothetical protein DMF68_06685 [Acidobacteriota bacterium]
MTLERLPSGLTQSYEYGPRGKVVKQSDNRGHSLTFERDASGAMVGLVTSNGAWVRATRDDDGRIVAITNSTGKSRRFAYDARGALVDYTDALGKHKKLGYDKRGRVHDITDNDGNRIVIDRDSSGRPQRVSLSDGTRLLYDYDRAGNLVGVSREGFRKESTPWFTGVSLNHAPGRSPVVASPQMGFGCFFGYDGFYTNWGFSNWDMTDSVLFGYDIFFSDMSMFAYGGGDLSCSDPFGGLADCSWYDGFDSWYSDAWFSFGCSSFGGMACTVCIARQLAICASQLRSCALRAIGSFLTSSIPCVALGFATGGLAGLICLALDSGSAGANGAACTEDYQSCVLAAQDKCTQCG